MSAGETVSVARVPTASASRYLQQLAKHWSHKFDTSFSPEEGRIDFGEGRVLTMRADSDMLDLLLTTPDRDDAVRMRGVVERHADYVNPILDALEGTEAP